MTLTAIIFILLGIIAIFGFGYFVGRNNPNIDAVNNLILKGELVTKTLADGVVGLEKFGTKVGAAASAAKKAL